MHINIILYFYDCDKKVSYDPLFQLFKYILNNEFSVNVQQKVMKLLRLAHEKNFCYIYYALCYQYNFEYSYFSGTVRV